MCHDYLSYFFSVFLSVFLAGAFLEDAFACRFSFGASSTTGVSSTTTGAASAFSASRLRSSSGRPMKSICNRVYCWRCPPRTRMRFLGRYLNRSSLGPLTWSTTVTLTRISLTVGVPTRISSPSAISKTRSTSNLLPVSTGRRSTSMVRPSTARYCLPPLSTIANLIFSPVIHFTVYLRSPYTRRLRTGKLVSYKQLPQESNHWGRSARYYTCSEGMCQMRFQDRYRLSSAKGLPVLCANLAHKTGDSSFVAKPLTQNDSIMVSNSPFRGRIGDWESSSLIECRLFS